MADEDVVVRHPNLGVVPQRRPRDSRHQYLRERPGRALPQLVLGVERVHQPDAGPGGVHWDVPEVGAVRDIKHAVGKEPARAPRGVHVEGHPVRGPGGRLTCVEDDLVTVAGVVRGLPGRAAQEGAARNPAAALVEERHGHGGEAGLRDGVPRQANALHMPVVPPRRVLRCRAQDGAEGAGGRGVPWAAHGGQHAVPEGVQQHGPVSLCNWYGGVAKPNGRVGEPPEDGKYPAAAAAVADCRLAEGDLAPDELLDPADLAMGLGGDPLVELRHPVPPQQRQVQFGAERGRGAPRGGPAHQDPPVLHRDVLVEVLEAECKGLPTRAFLARAARSANGRPPTAQHVRVCPLPIIRAVHGGGARRLVADPSLVGS
mmetsp:Transcript_78021/g.241870  ORF Transcript_78021/g.241870 Transcript_78021/m.241870 type:complete len:372 (-) Transcript_78021:361-1476(-)